MTIENGTGIVLAYVLVSMGVIVRDRMLHWSAAPALPRTERRRVS
jgi:hypothetical protein